MICNAPRLDTEGGVTATICSEEEEVAVALARPAVRSELRCCNATLREALTCAMLCNAPRLVTEGVATTVGSALEDVVTPTRHACTMDCTAAWTELDRAILHGQT